MSAEASERAWELLHEINAMRITRIGMEDIDMARLIDAALLRERNAQREADAGKADMISSLWATRQDHSSADRCATADAISRDIRATIESESKEPGANEV